MAKVFRVKVVLQRCSDVCTEEDAADRELQSKELARIMAAAHPRPVIFLGYVVTKPHGERRTQSVLA
jgi:hypothetical protein